MNFRHVVLGLFFVLGLTFSLPHSVAAQDVCNCVGSTEIGGPCYAGLGGPAYAGVGGPAYAGAGGPCDKTNRAPNLFDRIAPKANGIFGNKPAGQRRNNYDRGGACYAGIGGPCFRGAGGNANTCPGFC